MGGGFQAFDVAAGDVLHEVGELGHKVVPEQAEMLPAPGVVDFEGGLAVQCFVLFGQFFPQFKNRLIRPGTFADLVPEFLRIGAGLVKPFGGRSRGVLRISSRGLELLE